MLGEEGACRERSGHNLAPTHPPTRKMMPSRLKWRVVRSEPAETGQQEADESQTPQDIQDQVEPEHALVPHLRPQPAPTMTYW
jgi:hypothetical protein